MKIKDINGNLIEVTDPEAAIQQCRDCINSPYVMESGHTVGENHAYMLRQLLCIRQRRKRWLPSTRRRYESRKRFTKSEMAYEIGRCKPHHAAALYPDSMKRNEIVEYFNELFGTDIR